MAWFGEAAHGHVCFTRECGLCRGLVPFLGRGLCRSERIDDRLGLVIGPCVGQPSVDASAHGLPAICARAEAGRRASPLLEASPVVEELLPVGQGVSAQGAGRNVRALGSGRHAGAQVGFGDSGDDVGDSDGRMMDALVDLEVMQGNGGVDVPDSDEEVWRLVAPPVGSGGDVSGDDGVVLARLPLDDSSGDEDDGRYDDQSSDSDGTKEAFLKIRMKEVFKTLQQENHLPGCSVEVVVGGTERQWYESTLRLSLDIFLRTQSGARGLLERSMSKPL